MSSSLITDIHAHVLPGVDDGPGTLEEADLLLDAFSSLGTNRVFCTSHFRSPYFETSIDGLNVAYEQLCSSRGECATPVLKRGAEVRVTSSLVENIRSGNVPTLGDTSYVLVEFRSDSVSERSLQWVHELQVRGLQPIMAHPERNIELQKNPGKVGELIEFGMLMQLTAQSFEKSNADRVSAKLAWRILENGQAAVIASDAHNTTSRPPGLLKAYEMIAARLGQSVVDQLIENANAIWENRPCSEVQIPKKRGLIRSIFR